MYCGNCGKQLEDDMLFCPECGTPTQPGRASAENPVQNTAAVPVTPGLLLTLGILAVTLAHFGYAAILGTVFGVLGLNKSTQYVNMGGILSGKAKVGKILSIVGLVLGIVIFTFSITIKILFKVLLRYLENSFLHFIF